MDCPTEDLESCALGTTFPFRLVVGEDLWTHFGPRTVTVMADGVRTLRAIWKGAWQAGGGDNKFGPKALGPADTEHLIQLYMRKTRVPSKTLKTIGAVLK